MTQSLKTSYAALKRSVNREYSRSYDEDRDRFVSGTARTPRPREHGNVPTDTGKT